MNQQVNLYLPEFRKTREWLDAAGFLRFAGLFLGLLALLSLIQYGRVASLRGELDERQQALNEATARTEQLADRYAERTRDPGLAERLRQLEESLQGKQVLLDFLEGRDVGNSTGLSTYLEDLARYQVEGFRVTRIGISEGGDQVRLSGQVTRAENVPLFLSNLSQSPSYAGKRFRTLRITGERQRDEAAGGLLEFVVATSGGGGN